MLPASLFSLLAAAPLILAARTNRQAVYIHGVTHTNAFTGNDWINLPKMLNQEQAKQQCAQLAGDASRRLFELTYEPVDSHFNHRCLLYTNRESVSMDSIEYNMDTTARCVQGNCTREEDFEIREDAMADVQPVPRGKVIGSSSSGRAQNFSICLNKTMQHNKAAAADGKDIHRTVTFSTEVSSCYSYQPLLGYWLRPASYLGLAKSFIPDIGGSVNVTCSSQHVPEKLLSACSAVFYSVSNTSMPLEEFQTPTPTRSTVVLGTPIELVTSTELATPTEPAHSSGWQSAQPHDDQPFDVERVLKRLGLNSHVFDVPNIMEEWEHSTQASDFCHSAAASGSARYCGHHSNPADDHDNVARPQSDRVGIMHWEAVFRYEMMAGGRANDGQSTSTSTSSPTPLATGGMR